MVDVQDIQHGGTIMTAVIVRTHQVVQEVGVQEQDKEALGQVAVHLHPGRVGMVVVVQVPVEDTVRVEAYLGVITDCIETAIV